MGAEHARDRDELTPEALAERAVRQIIQGVKDLVRAEVLGNANEWIDQWSSPLRTGREIANDKPSRKHKELAADGTLPSRKVGRKILVRREDMNAYLKAHPERGHRADDEGVEDIMDEIVKGSGAGGRKR